MNSDFRDFFVILIQHQVEFLLIGGVAFNFHAPPRATKDIDVWVRPSRDNIERLVGALRAFALSANVRETTPRPKFSVL